MTDQTNKMSPENEDINTKNETIDNAEAQTQTEELDLSTILVEKENRIEVLEKELQIAKKNESEAMIRARAEIDNVRKRVEQDVDKARKFALEKFASELLPIIDTLERAIDSIDKENEGNKATLEGLELTLKSFLDTIKKFGIEVIETEGCILNPELHQAITMIDSPDHKTGEIVNAIQKGYTLNERLLRAAMVVVAK